MGYKLDNFDKNVERGVTGDHSFGSSWKQRLDNGLEPGLGHIVALTLDSDHVDPEQPVQGLQGHPGHLGVPVPHVLETHGEEVVPVVQEEHLLADTQQTGDQGEQSQTVFVSCAHV